MRTVLYLSALRKLWSKIDPVSTLRSLVLMTAPARASLMCSTLTTCSSWPSISNIVPLRKSLVEIITSSLLRQVLHRQSVACKSQAGDDALRRACRHTLRAELFACVDVREVHLDGGYLQRLQTVVDGERVVRQRPWVDHDPERAWPFLLQEVDDLAFVIALQDADRHAEIFCLRPHGPDEVGVRPGAVDLWLALSEQVQVGTVDDHDPFHARARVTTRRTNGDGTVWPGSAWPMRRGMTHATLPRRAFLSRGMAASTRAGSTCGTRLGSPYAVSSSSCVST